MGWGKREATTNLVILGDEGENKKKASGLLAAIVPDRGYPDKNNYELVQKDGESITLSGSASLARQIGPGDVGKFIKCEFTGWGKSANGKYKAIEVHVWEDEPTEQMKAWPRWKELHEKAKGGNGKPSGKQPVNLGPNVPGLDDEDFPGALQDEDDDLPF